MKWISVKERLPDNGVQVMILVEGLKGSPRYLDIAELLFEDLRGIHFWSGPHESYLVDDKEVTHWMYLPEWKPLPAIQWISVKAGPLPDLPEGE